MKVQIGQEDASEVNVRALHAPLRLIAISVGDLSPR